MALNEEMINRILEEYKDSKENVKIKEHYEKASERAASNYDIHSVYHEDLIDCQLKYHDDFGGSYYSLEEFTKMMLAGKEMAITTKLDKMFGEYFWLRFNSPTEVLCFRILCVVWNPDLIEINVKVTPTGPEVDFILRDIQGRIIYVIDIQGSRHNEKKDKERASELLQQGIRYIQMKGTDVKNNYVGVGVVFIKLLTELFKEKDMVFLTEKRYKSKNKKSIVNSTF